MLPEKIEKRPIYVIGHQNPDTDAICSAIGNAEFLRTHGEPDAVAARCGEMTLRTSWVLEKAGVPEPVLIHDVTPTAGTICRRDVISVESGRHVPDGVPPDDGELPSNHSGD